MGGPMRLLFWRSARHTPVISGAWLSSKEPVNRAKTSTFFIRNPRIISFGTFAPKDCAVIHVDFVAIRTGQAIAIHFRIGTRLHRSEVMSRKLIFQLLYGKDMLEFFLGGRKRHSMCV